MNPPLAIKLFGINPLAILFLSTRLLFRLPPKGSPMDSFEEQSLVFLPPDEQGIPNLVV